MEINCKFIKKRMKILLVLIGSCLFMLKYTILWLIGYYFESFIVMRLD